MKSRSTQLASIVHVTIKHFLFVHALESLFFLSFENASIRCALSSVCCHHFVAIRVVFFCSILLFINIMLYVCAVKYSVVSVSTSFWLQHIAHNMNATKYQMEINLSNITVLDTQLIVIVILVLVWMQLNQRDVKPISKSLVYLCLVLIDCHVLYDTGIRQARTSVSHGNSHKNTRKSIKIAVRA